MLKPLISCVMPTANRPQYVSHAIKVFLSQSYENKNLFILDDGQFPSIDKSLIDNLWYQNIYYKYIGPKRRSIPVKRNTLCDMATGTIIAHLDDDDWSSINRLLYQYETMMHKGAEVTGFNKALLFDERSLAMYRYSGAPFYAVGGTLMFTKAHWLTNKFDEMIARGSDDDLVERSQKQIFPVDGRDMYVALTHAKSTNQRSFHKAEYTRLQHNAIPDAFKYWYSGVKETQNAMSA